MMVRVGGENARDRNRIEGESGVRRTGRRIQRCFARLVHCDEKHHEYNGELDT